MCCHPLRNRDEKYIPCTRDSQICYRLSGEKTKLDITVTKTCLLGK